MTTEQKDFETKYYGKIVQPIKEKAPFLPLKNYLVTAALYKWEDGDVTVFAVQALDYSAENKHWFTFKIYPDELEEILGSFEIIQP